MKKLLLVVTLMTAVQVCFAQVPIPAIPFPKFKEWFKQKKTQIEYYGNQIAALWVYIDYLEKGYTIAKDGTNLINDIKHGDFNIHNGYFNSLKAVNPSIRNYAKVAEIISDQSSVNTGMKKLVGICDDSEHLSADDKNYVHSVYDNMKEQSANDLNELYLVVTAGQAEMKDDERLQKIQGIYVETKEKLSFTKTFFDQTLILIRQRMAERADLEKSKIITGVN